MFCSGVEALTPTRRRPARRRAPRPSSRRARSAHDWSARSPVYSVQPSAAARGINPSRCACIKLANPLPVEHRAGRCGRAGHRLHSKAARPQGTCDANEGDGGRRPGATTVRIRRRPSSRVFESLVPPGGGGQLEAEPSLTLPPSSNHRSRSSRAAVTSSSSPLTYAGVRGGGSSGGQSAPHCQHNSSWRAIGASQEGQRRGTCRSRMTDAPHTCSVMSAGSPVVERIRTSSNSPTSRS